MTPIGIELTGAACTDVGRVRRNNEDAYLFDIERGLFAVADGMGGHNAGEVASRMAVRGLYEAGDSIPDERFLAEGSVAGRQQILAWMDRTVREINLRIHTQAREDPALHGMGCTLEVALFRANGVFIGHVGDSRSYLLRERGLYALTEDHNLKNLMVARGRATPEEAARHPQRDALTRALGPSPDVSPDTAYFEVGPRDVFLLCSDGLHGEVPEPQIQAQLLDLPADRAPAALVQAALAAGGRDNVTPLVVSVLRCAVARSAVVGSERVRAALAGADLFAQLTDNELIRVQKLAVARRARAGEILVHQGRAGGSLLLPIEGRFSLWREDQPIGGGGPGDHIGEEALMGVASPITARAESEMLLLEFPESSLQDLLLNEVAITAKVSFALYQRLAARAIGVLDSLARYRRVYGPTPR